MSPRAAIVIPSYGRPDLLRRTLQSLVDAQWPPSFTGVWVVENGPKTGLETLCGDFAARLPLHYVHEPLVGSSAAPNAGARACEGEVILFLDHDVRAGWDTLLARADACADRVTYRPTSGVSCRNGQFSGASLKTGRYDFYRRETEFGQCSNC